MITFKQYKVLRKFIDHKATRLISIYILDLDKYRNVTQQLIVNKYIELVTIPATDNRKSYRAYQITPIGAEEYDRFVDHFGAIMLFLKLLKFVGCDIIVPIIVSIITSYILQQSCCA